MSYVSVTQIKANTCFDCFGGSPALIETTSTVILVNGHVLVTGAAGFIGSHLCELLLHDGWLVTGIDSFAPTYETGLRRSFIDRLQSQRSFRFIEGDLLNVDLDTVLPDIDAVFHLAARPGVRSSWENFRSVLDANVMATKKLLYAMVRTNTEARLVFASSSSVYGAAQHFPTSETDLLRPISPYGVTKASAEQLVSAYVSQYEVDAVTLRYFTVYGPRQRPEMAFSRWIAAALSGQPLTIFGDGSAVRDFTYVTDVVAATVSALDAPADTYNVAGGSPTSMSDAISVISELTRPDVEVEYQPSAVGDPAQTGGDISRISQAVGWNPQVQLHEGLEHQIAWLRDA